MGVQGISWGRGFIEHHSVFSIMLYFGRETKDTWLEKTLINREIIGKENREIEHLRARRDNGEKKD